ncbi:BnaC04g12820D [Brassica napus]|uniref:BnaC04g12820D protein n=1 Tax=Brassica napus TaxID=3708 RepID=A0A078HA51_BRANA|nr:BnaC04g12820D [Brassica napus]
MRWRRNIKAFGLVDKTWQQVMDRRRRKLTVKKMMRRMKSRKIHSRKRSAGETGMEGEDKRDLTAADGEEAAFKDISPLMVLVRNCYKRSVVTSFTLSNAFMPSGLFACLIPYLTDSAKFHACFDSRTATHSVRTRQGDTSIKTADELSKIMAFLFEWCCQFPRTDSFSPVAIYSVRLKSRDFALSTISLS